MIATIGSSILREDRARLCLGRVLRSNHVLLRRTGVNNAVLDPLRKSSALARTIPVLLEMSPRRPLHKWNNLIAMVTFLV